MKNLNKIKKLNIFNNDIFIYHQKFKDKYEHGGIKIKYIINDIFYYIFPYSNNKNKNILIILGLTNKNSYALVLFNEINEKNPFIFYCSKRDFNYTYKKNLYEFKNAIEF